MYSCATIYFSDLCNGVISQVAVIITVTAARTSIVTQVDSAFREMYVKELVGR
jgi:hypothetical protein